MPFIFVATTKNRFICDSRETDADDQEQKNK